MGGGVRQSLNFKEFKYLPVILPPLPEQQAIASFLDRECGKIDALIAEQERLIALLAEKRQAVISHAVTKGLNPNAPMKDSGIPWIGMVPEGWDVVKIKYLCSVISDCLHETPTYEGILSYPAIRTSDIEVGEVLLNKCKLVSEEIYKTRTSRYIPKENDVLYSREGERFGISALVPKNTKICLGQRMMVFSVYDFVYSKYFMWTLNSPEMLYQVKSTICGSTSPHINISDIKNFSIFLPNVKCQKIVGEYLSNVFENMKKMVSLSEEAITLLKERRAALISAAVTGKIDVRAQSKAIAA